MDAGMMGSGGQSANWKTPASGDAFPTATNPVAPKMPELTGGNQSLPAPAPSAVERRVDWSPRILSGGMNQDFNGMYGEPLKLPSMGQNPPAGGNSLLSMLGGSMYSGNTGRPAAFPSQSQLLARAINSKYMG